MLALLFLSFSLIGLGAYGGGLVTVPLIQHEIVTVRHWIRFDEMARLLAIAQMTPGPIAVNAATFVGFRTAGIAGAIVATTAVLLPSLCILIFLSPLIERFGDNIHVRKIRRSIGVGVVSLLFYAVWSYGTAAIGGWPDLLIAGGAFGLLVAGRGKLHPMLIVAGCGAAGLLVFL